jgi:O-antigen biosynthesis protein
MPTMDEEDSKKDLVFTGERFMPHQTDPLLALEHYHRYYLASRFAQGKRILDVGCGEGYGSAFLSQLADTVIGMDIDPKTIDHARRKYSNLPNLTFEVGRCEEAFRKHNSFDMVVGFELLEHLDPDDQARFLKSILQTLKPDGLFVVSSPERDEYADIHQTMNEFHRHEMTAAELKSFLGGFFKHVHLCGQRVLSLSTMWQMRDRQGEQFQFHSRKDLLKEIPRGEPFSQPLYLIALCSNAPLPQNAVFESNSFYLDAGNSDPSRDFSRWALQLNSQAEKNEELIHHLENLVEERTAWIRRLESEAQKNQELVHDLQNQVEDRTAWALRLESEAQKNGELVHDLQNQVEVRTAWALKLDGRIQAQDERIATLNAELENRTKWALSLESDVAKERAYSNEISRVISGIRKKLTSSLIYRVLAKMKLLPRV